MEIEIKDINYETDDALKILTILPLKFRRELFSDTTIYDKIYDYVKQHKNNDNIEITHVKILFEEDKYEVFYHYFDNETNQDIEENMKISVTDIIK